MTDAISLLEQLALAPYDVPEDLFDVAATEPGVQAALQARDAAGLAAALGMKSVMACMVFTPDENEPTPSESPDEQSPTPAEPEPSDS